MKILLPFLALLAFYTPTLRAESTAIRAILVSASPQAGETDPSLAPYEATLRRILRFERFSQLGEGRASLEQPGKATLSLGQGHTLGLQSDSAGDALRLQVTWTDNGRALMRTGLVLRPGVPAVLGGPTRGKSGEVLAVILIAD